MSPLNDKGSHQYSFDEINDDETKDEHFSEQIINEKRIEFRTKDSERTYQKSRKNQFDEFCSEETINDYSFLLSDFLTELEVGNLEENEEAMICKADVVFFAKELQWRFEMLKTQLTNFKCALEQEDIGDSLALVLYKPNNECETRNLNYAEKSGSSQLHIQGKAPVEQMKTSPHPPKATKSTKSNEQTEKQCSLSNNEENLKRPLTVENHVNFTCKSTQTMHDNEMQELRDECESKNQNIQNLKTTLKSLEDDLYVARQKEESQNLQLLHAQSRLKYLEIAIQKNLNHNPSHFRSTLLDSIARKSIMKENKVETCTPSIGIHEQTDQHFPSIEEEMRMQIIRLANALEKSESEKSALYKERMQEREKNAKLIRSLGENVKKLINSGNVPDRP